MSTYIYANDPSLYGGTWPTLSSDVTESQTTIQVTSTAYLPVWQIGTQYIIRIDAELLLVTGVSGLNLAVVRGAENSNAAEHAAGTPVTCKLTAGSLPPSVQNPPVCSATYSANPWDYVVLVAAGSTLTWPAAPVVGRIYRAVPLPGGILETNPVTVNGNGYQLADPQNLNSYAASVTMRTSGATAAWLATMIGSTLTFIGVT